MDSPKYIRSFNHWVHKIVGVKYILAMQMKNYKVGTEF
jgi:hypothetical protein